MRRFCLKICEKNGPNLHYSIIIHQIISISGRQGKPINNTFELSMNIRKIHFAHQSISKLFTLQMELY